VTDAAAGRRLPFGALRHRNFRLFLAGQLVSLCGSWMQQVALGWLVYRLTGSPLLLGLVGFCTQFPALLVAPFAGVWADRANRHRVVVATQVAGMVQASLMAALVLSGHVSIAGVLALSVLLGIVSGVDAPTRHAFIVEMVDRPEDLPSAVALNSSIFQASRLIGPSIAGVLIAAVGEGMVFLLNAASYVAVIGALLALRVKPHVPAAAHPAVLGALREGVRYAFGSPALRAPILLVAGVSLVGMPFTVLLPVIAAEVLRGGAPTFGFLAGAMGLGALLGALALAARRSPEGLPELVRAGSAAFGVALVALAASRSLPLAAACCFFGGVAVTVAKAGSNTLLQLGLEPRIRGRVMSFYTMALIGVTPVGSLGLGALADRVGAPAAIGAGGLATLVVAAAFSRALPALRRETPVAAAAPPAREPAELAPTEGEGAVLD
jgi:MFS family permease